MSLLWWDAFRSSRILNQNFGLSLDPEDLTPLTLPLERSLFISPAGYLRPWRSQASAADTGSVVTSDKDKFQVNLDVQHFTPEEIKVTSLGNTLTVEGKHEEKLDEHGFISRHFVRRYILPEGLDVNQIQSSLSSDGVLTISAPRKAVEEKEEKTIPVQQTGQPIKPVQIKKEEVSKEETKPEESKTEGSKQEESKTDQSKQEESEIVETKKEEIKEELAKTGEDNEEESKNEVSKTEESSKEENKLEEGKTEESKVEEIKNKEIVSVETSKEKSKIVESKKEETEQDESRKEEKKTEKSKPVESKKEETKQQSKTEASKKGESKKKESKK